MTEIYSIRHNPTTHKWELCELASSTGGVIATDMFKVDAERMAAMLNSHAAMRDALQLQYLWMLRNIKDGPLRRAAQVELTLMRDAIADATGQRAQAVQDAYEAIAYGVQP